MSQAPVGEDIFFDHVQLYVKSLRTLEMYQALEAESTLGSKAPLSQWENNDLVAQLIVGFGYRVTGYYEGISTRNILVSTPASYNGSSFVLTTIKKEEKGEGEEKYFHFEEQHPTNFLACHNGRQGVGVISFRVSFERLERIYHNYQKFHPTLLRYGPQTFQNGQGSYKYVEAYAYHLGNEVDIGTVIRFCAHDELFPSLPGLVQVDATYPPGSLPAYADHWVSNVYDRQKFIQTLSDVVGFTPKVDFNAGVVAAGEAKIESTVVGNSSRFTFSSVADVLVDQSQIYLPINNSLSTVGHVHLFLQEIGQGVQHIASRVSDLVGFVERANESRTITGIGLSFLKIPRSYYGLLSEDDIIEIGVEKETASGICAALRQSNLMDLGGIVKLDIKDEDIYSTLSKSVNEQEDTFLKIVQTIKKSRYVNMYKLLRETLTEETYLRIVKNQVLVDIQGQDVLLQIFTSNILQENVTDEAPFLEFIQRVCFKAGSDSASTVLRAGCGGFGIRNFLTLFLSIELSKAMEELSQATIVSNHLAASRAQKRIEVFTEQLSLSNPILTSISDAMTAEAIAVERLGQTVVLEERKNLELDVEKAQRKKANAQAELIELSAHFADLMAQIRLLEN
eukprot:TRINITY_DN6577_c0_g2_i5.p1 TRINITY_DN6577_c0_g2~~TRINITY_DN6577_c0_g2_i5.p1  ORF type:complete len:622 (-),score=112.09 TRINITY_DN6577_c0_g2_i5:202-2067(-)